MFDFLKKKDHSLPRYPTGVEEPGTPPFEPLPGEPAWQSETAPPRPMPQPQPFERVAPMMPEHTEQQPTKDNEIINLKLDAIKNALESVNMRLERLENLLQHKSEQEAKKVWYR